MQINFHEQIVKRNLYVCTNRFSYNTANYNSCKPSKTSDRELKNAISLLSLDFPCVNYLLDTENLGISFGALPLYTHMHA